MPDDLEARLGGIASANVADQIAAARERREAQQRRRKALAERRRHGLTARHRLKLRWLAQQAQDNDQTPDDAA